MRPSSARKVGSWSDLPLEDVAVELHRARHVVEVLLVELRDPVLEARRLVRIARHLALASEHRQQLGPVLCALVEHVEPRERLQIVRIDLEDLRVRVDRARDVAELALVDGADLVVNPLLLVDVGDQIGLACVDGEQLLPARQIEVAPDERVDRAQIVRVDLEHLAVDGDRRLGPAEDVLLDQRGLEERVLLVRRLLEDLGLSLQDDRQLRVPLRCAEQALERLGRRETERIDLEHLAVESDRRVDVAEIGLLNAGARHVERAGQRRILDLAGELREDLREVVEAAGRPGDAIELLLRRLVRRVFLQRARERGEGGRELARRVLVELGDLVEELDASSDVLASTDLHFVRRR